MISVTVSKMHHGYEAYNKSVRLLIFVIYFGLDIAQSSIEFLLFELTDQ